VNSFTMQASHISIMELGVYQLLLKQARIPFLNCLHVVDITCT
jgi:hypothetical protein